MDVPKLGEKLELLFRFDRVITTKQALADAMGLKLPAITRWVTGRYEFRYRNEEPHDSNRIPDKHVGKFLRLFGLQKSWLEETDMEVFESHLLTRTVERTAWENLLLRAEASGGLRLKRRPARRRRTRLGYQSPAEVPQGGPFHYYERVYVELELEDRWVVNAKEGEPLAYTVILWTSGHTARCLCPSDDPAAPDYRLTERRTLLPSAAPEACVQVWPITGLHSVIALITKQPFSDVIYEELKREWPADLSPVLEKMAESVLRRPEESWQCLRLDYLVEPDAG